MDVGSKVVDLEEYRDLRWLVESNIKAFVKSGTVEARMAMMDTVAGVMRKYHRRRMSFGSYNVALVRIEDKDFPIIRARRTADSCPGCGQQRVYCTSAPRSRTCWGGETLSPGVVRTAARYSPAGN